MAKNPRVFLDIAVDFKTVGRIVIELFADTNPLAAENFRALCTGEKGIGESGIPLHYKGSIIHRVAPTAFWYAGDITHGNGFGGESIYGYYFKDENFTRKHDRKGVLSMINLCDYTGERTYGSQFSLFMRECPGIDGKQVVFGQVVDGYDVISRVDGMVGDGVTYPSKPVTIAECGQILPEAEITGGSISTMAGSSDPAKYQKLLNQLRFWQLKFADMENTLGKQTISYAMGCRKIKIEESMALQALIMAPRTYRAVEQSVQHESEGEGAGHDIPEEL